MGNYLRRSLARLLKNRLYLQPNRTVRKPLTGLTLLAIGGLLIPRRPPSLFQAVVPVDLNPIYLHCSRAARWPFEQCLAFALQLTRVWSSDVLPLALMPNDNLNLNF